MTGFSGPTGNQAVSVLMNVQDLVWDFAAVGMNKILSQYFCWLLNVSVSIECVYCSVGLSPGFKSLTLH